MGELVQCDSCGILLVFNENTRKYHEYTSHNVHYCPKYVPKAASNHTSTEIEDRAKCGIPPDFPYQGICICTHWHGKNYHCVHETDGVQCICNNFDFPGSPYPKIKAGTIICPIRNCRHVCIEGEDPVQVQLKQHMKSAHSIVVTDAFMEYITDKINNYRNNERLRYRDPFVYVSFEELYMKEYIRYTPMGKQPDEVIEKEEEVDFRIDGFG